MATVPVKIGKVTKKTQTINSNTITLPAGQPRCGDVVTLPKVTATSGLPVTIKVVSGPASIANGRITFTGSGKVTIQLDQSGNTAFFAAPSLRADIIAVRSTAQATKTIPFNINKTNSIRTYNLNSLSGIPATNDWNVVAIGGIPQNISVTTQGFGPGNTSPRYSGRWFTVSAYGTTYRCVLLTNGTLYVAGNNFQANNQVFKSAVTFSATDSKQTCGTNPTLITVDAKVSR